MKKLFKHKAFWIFAGIILMIGVIFYVAKDIKEVGYIIAGAIVVAIIGFVANLLANDD